MKKTVRGYTLIYADFLFQFCRYPRSSVDDQRKVRGQLKGDLYEFVI